MGKRGYPSVVEIYDGEIAAMRKEGNTLQSIGDKIGVTRERVRQILNEYYPGIRSELLSEAQVAQICGCWQQHLGHLRIRGMVSPVRMGGIWRYNRDEIERAYMLTHKTCLNCGRPIGTRPKYCKECGIEQQRYGYPFMSFEAKERFKVAQRQRYMDRKAKQN